MSPQREDEGKAAKPARRAGLAWAHVDAASSEIIRGWAYDRDQTALYVRFYTGTTYRYEGVPLAVVRDWAKVAGRGSSIGSYFHTYISKYPYTKVQAA